MSILLVPWSRRVLRDAKMVPQDAKMEAPSPLNGNHEELKGASGRGRSPRDLFFFLGRYGSKGKSCRVPGASGPQTPKACCVNASGSHYGTRKASTSQALGPLKKRLSGMPAPVSGRHASGRKPITYLSFDLANGRTGKTNKTDHLRWDTHPGGPGAAH